MQTRKLGNSDLDLTPIGFGAWAIGGDDWGMGWGPQEDADSIAAIHEALECGVNWIDTAHAYGFGKSEEVVGRALKEWSGDVIIATKCGVLPNEVRFPYRDANREKILEEVEGSLKCQKISPDSEIPFPDNHFDLIYAIEVIEHTRRPYDLFCEAYNRLKPGGTFLLTTPNSLHMKSRLEFLLTGFGDMYPPVSTLEKNAGRICGHIMPLNLAYFAYGARKVGFGEPEFHVDRRKRSSVFWAMLFWPLLKMATWYYDRKIRKYDLDDWEENRDVIGEMNSYDLLTARSCFITFRKPLPN